MLRFRSLPAVLALVAAPLPAADAAPEALPPGATVVALEVRPAAVELLSPFAYAQLLVTARLSTGEAVDATRLAAVAGPPAVKVSPLGVVRPAADGAGDLTVSVGGKRAVVPVRVGGLGAAPAVSFVKDVEPALSKMGCNAGTCHGAAQGKVGFKLSLRGYDPLYDHRALTDDLEARRFNRAAPDRSLMLLKPAGGVPHVGGVLCQPGEPYYELVKAWIADGARLDLQTPRVASLEIFPKDPIVPRLGMKQQFAAVATFTDGSKRDVSAEAFVDSSNSEVATVDKAGLMTAVRRGEATMLARYEGSYAASTVVVMGDRSGFAWTAPPQLNYIDELVDAKLQKVKVVASPLCDDSEFVRRVHIDLTGLPPTASEVRAFLADARPTRAKRDELIDHLIGSEAFVEYWTNKWADLLQVNRKFLGDAGAAGLRKWIKDAVAANMPYDQFAAAVLTASGSNMSNPPASYFKVLRTPDEVMENTTQLFLAVRFNCNKCHDHPFEKWTQDQYYQLAAYFARVGRTEDPKFKGQKIGGTEVEGAKPLAEVIADVAGGEVKHDRTGQVSPPKFPFTHPGAPAADLPRRVQAARWITSKDNPYFAKSYVNRLWSYLTGVGIIEPVDDIRAGNPPTNPALLDRLTAEFVGSGFDTRKLIATVCKSRTYQLSITTNSYNKDDDINYSHAVPRRLPAEVLFDSIYRATGTTSRLPGLPPGARAAQLVDSNVVLPGGFLELFGKPVRESACECERSNTMMLGPVLALVNGPVVGDAVQDPAGHLLRFTAATPDDARVVDEIYLSVLNRRPTAAELAAGAKALHAAGPDHARLWAEYAPKKAALDAHERTAGDRQKAWETGLRAASPTPWLVADPVELKSKNGATFTRGKDGSVLVGGKLGGPEELTVALDSKLIGVTGLRLEALADPALPGKGPGRAANGNFVLSELKVTARPLDKPGDKPTPVTFGVPSATFSQDGYGPANAVDGNPATGWAVVPRTGEDHVAVFPFAKPVGGPSGVRLSVTLDQRHPDGTHSLGKFRLSVTTAADPRAGPAVSADVAALLAVPVGQRTPAQAEKLRGVYLAQDAEGARLRAAAANPPPADARVLGAQDLVWALINSPAFLFNH